MKFKRVSAFSWSSSVPSFRREWGGDILWAQLVALFLIGVSIILSLAVLRFKKTLS